ALKTFEPLPEHCPQLPVCCKDIDLLHRKLPVPNQRNLILYLITGRQNQLLHGRRETVPVQMIPETPFHFASSANIWIVCCRKLGQKFQDLDCLFPPDLCFCDYFPGLKIG